MAKEGCDKNCATCDIGNRAYCAVQLGLKNQELLMNMQTIISGLIQVLTPILTPGSAPIQSPNLGGDVPAEEKPKAEEAPNKKKIDSILKILEDKEADPSENNIDS